MTQFPPPQPYVPPTMPHGPSRAPRGLAIAGISVGGVALVVAFVPVCGASAIPLAMVGVALAIAAAIASHIARQPNKPMCLTGMMLSIVAGLIGWYQLAMVERALNLPSKRPGPTMAEIAAAGHQPVAAPPTATPPSTADLGPVTPSRLAVTQKNARIRVAAIERIASDTAGDHLLIAVEVTHAGSTGSPVLNLRPWTTQPMGADSGRAARLLSADAVALQGVPLEETPSRFELSGGQTATATLRFVIPSTIKAPLRLELPAENFGGTGLIRFSIADDQIPSR